MMPTSIQDALTRVACWVGYWLGYMYGTVSILARRNWTAYIVCKIVFRRLHRLSWDNDKHVLAAMHRSAKQRVLKHAAAEGAYSECGELASCCFRLRSPCLSNPGSEQFFVNRHIAREVRAVHEQLDGVGNLFASTPDEAVASGEWQDEWRNQQRGAFREEVPAFLSALEHCATEEQRAEWLVLLGNELQRYRDDYSEEDLAFVERELKSIGISWRRLDVPAWFVPPNEIMLDSSLFPDSVVGLLRRKTNLLTNSGATWMSRNVRVWYDKVDRPREGTAAFTHKVSLWFQLNHPSIERLFGACHLGDAFYICPKYRGSTTWLFEQRHRWSMLLSAANGVQYLHDRDIVHGHIQLDQIRWPWNLDGVVIGLQKWEPEKAADPNVDVQGLGLVAAQVMSRSLHPDTRLANPPECVSGEQWELIRKMCSSDVLSGNGVLLEEVILQFTNFATEEARGAPVRGGASVKGPTSLTTWVDASTKSTIPVLINSIREQLTAPPVDDDPSARQSEQRYLCQRVADIFESVKNRDPPVTSTWAKDFASTLKQVNRETRRAMAMSSALSVFSSVGGNALRMTTAQYALNRQLDELMLQQRLSPEREMHQWQRRWDDRHRRSVHNWEPSPSSINVPEDPQVAEAEHVIAYELSKRQSRYDGKDTVAMQKLLESVVKRESEAPRQLRSVPEWFIPPYEVEIEPIPFSSGSFGSVHHGVWRGLHVVVKKISLSKDDDRSENQRKAFFREVDVWFQLHHAHVLQLYGACHVGDPFFVCEFAGEGQLDEYWKRGAERRYGIWRNLHEAAMGLQYLHGKGIVHADLKCNNILLSHHRSLLADFGLSLAFQHRDGNKGALGAYRWKAPEVLRGEPPSLASDIYSLGMCVIEVLSGKLPWGDVPDVAVKYHVLHGKLPRCPSGFREMEWNLVKHMCHFEPRERLPIGSVVAIASAIATQLW
jgi:hypothetical protein